MRLLPTLTCALLACVGLLASGLSAPPAAASSPVHCSEIDLRVSVPNPRETVHGQLCMPAGRGPTTVQLFVHSATYSHVYWISPTSPSVTRTSATWPGTATPPSPWTASAPARAASAQRDIAGQCRSGSDPGYFTTRPELRPAFYEVSDADPQVFATDDATKDQLSILAVRRRGHWGCRGGW